MCVRHETDIPCRCCCCRCSAAEMTSTVCVYTREQRCCKAIRKRNKFSLVRASARAAQRSHAHIRDFKSMRSHARTHAPFFPVPRMAAPGPGERTREYGVPNSGRGAATRLANRAVCSREVAYLWPSKRGRAIRTNAHNSQFAEARTHVRNVSIYYSDDGAERERERAEGGCGIFMRPFHPRCPAPGVCR